MSSVLVAMTAAVLFMKFRTLHAPLTTLVSVTHLCKNERGVYRTHAALCAEGLCLRSRIPPGHRRRDRSTGRRSKRAPLLLLLLLLLL